MPVYVDTLVVYPNAWGPFLKGSCHMAADTPEELHAMAAKLGMKRAWYQDDPRHPHYDLVKSKRDKAIQLGAQAVSTREMVLFWRRIREAAMSR